jgi:hypothetical protein
LDRIRAMPTVQATSTTIVLRSIFERPLQGQTPDVADRGD